MGSTKALIVGASKYFIPGANDLPFCKNDIIAIKSAFIYGLKVASENIITCGLADIVTIDDFMTSLSTFEKIAQDDDTLLFYFSGHGITIDSNHYLVLSDKLINTQKIIAYLDAIPAKSKVIFLDCCLAGNFQVGGSAILDVESTASNFAGKGYAVFASSNASQYSYSHPSKPISLFTNFLCDAITSKFLIREGKKSLNDIHRLLFLFLETWNKNNPTCIQTPIYRANMGGTIFFDVEDYHPYIPKKFFYDDEKYCICTVEPLHSGIAKRYAVKVILKEPLSLEEISLVNLEIVNKVKYLNIFSNKTQEMKWNHKPVNLIFCYFGLDQADIASANYICHTTWADDTQDKEHWYRISKKSDDVINGIHFNVHSYYQSLKEFTAKHTATSEEIIRATKTILTEMINLAESVILQYNELLNKEMTEECFIACISDTLSRIDVLYFKQGDLDLPPKELLEWSQLCSNLATDIHDFTLFYAHPYFLQQTPESRQQCMTASIEQYYKDLEHLKNCKFGS